MSSNVAITTTTITTSTTEPSAPPPSTPPTLDSPSPTMVALPPRPNGTTMIENTTATTSNSDDALTRTTETISLLDDEKNNTDINTNTPNTTNTMSVIVDTSRDAEIAAAFAAEEQAAMEQERWMQGSTGTIGTFHNVSETTTTGSTIDLPHHQQPHQPHHQQRQQQHSVATVSAPWQYDDLHSVCYKCHDEFHPILNRKHHCRYCGFVFCHKCTNYKALIPPSLIVLHPITGKKTKPPDYSDSNNHMEHVSFSPNPDPDRMLTYIAPNNNNKYNNSDDVNGGTAEQQVLYGRGLEERFQLAREPLRVCHACYQQVQHLQEDLRYHNSHAMRYNTIDPTHPQRLFNSPFANTLGHEIRKAAYALNNLLPQPKRRMGALVDVDDRNPYGSSNHNPIHADIQQCKDTCSTISPNLNDLDGVQIPARLLEMAKGVAIMTVIKGGFGFAGVEFGTGLVVARLPNIHPTTNALNPTSPTSTTDSTNNSHNHSANFRWSAPSAIGTAGLSWGALIGAQVSDHVFLLMSDEAVALLYNNKASIQLGADIAIAIGPLGRTLEGDLGVDGKHNKIAPIYTYSMSKGLYAGVSLDGKVIVTRPDVNEKFYGMSISAEEILAGVVPTPPAAQPLYEALHRCHVYATMAEEHQSRRHTTVPLQSPMTNFSQQHTQYTPNAMDDSLYMSEYGEHQLQSQPQISNPQPQMPATFISEDPTLLYNDAITSPPNPLLG